MLPRRRDRWAQRFGYALACGFWIFVGLVILALGHAGAKTLALVVHALSGELPQ